MTFNSRMTYCGNLSHQQREKHPISCYLSPELWDVILPRVPVKTLIRFRCVCRRWCSVMDEPSFVSKYHLQYKNNRERSHLLVVEDSMVWGKWRWTIRLSDTLLKTHELDRHIRFTDYNIFDYFDGVVVLVYAQEDVDNSASIVLLNPSIKKFIKIPSFHHVLKPGDSWRFALGLDSCNNEYKLVVTTTRGCAVYSLKTGSWKRVAGAPASHGVRCQSCHSSPVFLKGAVHWIAMDFWMKLGAIIPDHYVAIFDTHTEHLRCMDLPNQISDQFAGRQSLAILGDDSLALLEVRWNDNCTIWVMEENGVAKSWKKIFQTTTKLSPGEFIHLKRNGELLFAKGKEDVESYDIDTNVLKNLGNPSPPQDNFTATYIESLVLFSQGTSLELA